MKKWKILNELRIRDKGLMIKDLIKILLENRGVKTEREVEEFLNPRLENVTIGSVGINKKELKKAIERIKLAIKNKEKIVVYGDYDVDGISGTAILWETLNSARAKVMPYIPHRIDEGYGLSIKGINNVILNLFQDPEDSKREMLNSSKRTFLCGGGAVRHDSGKGLIITVDNGIVANKAVDFANKQGIDVVVTDHHAPSRKLPDTLAVVHTVKLCGTGVAYLLAEEMLKQVQHDNGKHLELVALATVADLVPLKGANRTLLKFGLGALRKTTRRGLMELFKEAGIDKNKIGVYEIGHLIAPRLNATGRLDYAMDSLRLLCTTNKKRAEILAKEIGATNRERQLLTINTAQHAIDLVKNSTSLKLRGANKKEELKKLLFVAHESYQQGVIGLVAGKLVEEFYRPAIVISKGKKFSKASARSVKGFNMIEFIRTVSEFLVDAGGHPMAAGFTVETEKIPMLEKALRNKIGNLLDGDILERKLKIDCEIPLSLIDNDLYGSLQKLSPFGMGNPEPVFISKNVIIEDMRLVGMDGKHLKIKVKGHLSPEGEKSKIKSDGIEGIGFNMGEKAGKFSIGDKIDVVYAIDKDEWNGGERLQLKIKELQKID